MRRSPPRRLEPPGGISDEHRGAVHLLIILSLEIYFSLCPIYKPDEFYDLANKNRTTVISQAFP